ncbi:MAG: alpha/beta fold hydrolase, partial [Euryarchaeota archaeon]|nr:alpha/beta fold hydrolase [Euryarchaeota archaeon]
MVERLKYPVEFEGKLVFFTATDRVKLSGFLVPAEGKDVAVFVHGMGGSFAKDGVLSGARKLVEQGISFFSFTNRGAEIVKSFKNARGDRYMVMGTAFEKFEDSARDIKGALNYLESIGYERFHLIGHSTGCQKILYYAWKRRDKRVKSLIFLSPSDDYPIWRVYLGEDFGKAVEIAQNMKDLGHGDELHYFVYRRTGAIWSASRFLSFADRDCVEASLFNYDSSLNILSRVHLPMQFFFGTADDTLFYPLEFYEKKIRDAYMGPRLEVEKIKRGDHSFHGKEDEV